MIHYGNRRSLFKHYKLLSQQIKTQGGTICILVFDISCLEKLFTGRTIFLSFISKEIGRGKHEYMNIHPPIKVLVPPPPGLKLSVYTFYNTSV